MHEIIFNRNGLSLEKLNLLCEIAHHGSIKATVGEEPSSQSLASRQIKELSNYIGTPLLRRAGRSIELTEQAAKLVRISEEFLDNLESFLIDTRNLVKSFKLGVGDSIFQWYLLPKMKNFELETKVGLLPSSLPTNEIIKKVSNREFDAGLIRHCPISNGDITTEIIGEINYNLFIPKQLLPHKEHLKAPPSLAKIPICTLTGNGTYAQSISKLLNSYGTSPQLACSSTTQIFGAVLSGQFAAILPERAQNGFSQEIKSFKMTELAAFSRKISLIYSKIVRRTESQLNALNYLRKIIN